jgi:superfamily II DNA or RNA helicase
MIFRYDAEKEKLILSSATRIEYHQLDIWLTRKPKGWKFMPAVKMGVWDGNITYFDAGKVNLGLWKECLLAAKEIGVKFDIENKKDFPLNRDITLESVQEFCTEFFKNHKVLDKKTNEWKSFTPYDYQIETAYKIMKNRYCMAEVATSGGKSLVISIVILYTLHKIDPNAKILIIVPSISLVTQFYDNIMEYNYGENNMQAVRDSKIDAIINDSKYPVCDLRIEEIMSDKPRKYSGVSDPNIYIGCYQSLEKWPKEFFKQFHTVACDEAHQSKAKTITDILERTYGTAYNRFGVSGTFPVDDSCEILTIQSVLGPKVTQIEADLLVKQGKITPMKIKTLKLNYNETELNQKLKSARNPNNGRDIYQFEKDWIQQNEKRLEFIKKLVDKKCQNNTLVLFHTIEYGQRLFNKISEIDDDIEVYYIDGSVSNKERQIIIEHMNRTDKKKILVASFGTLSTGVSINSIFNVIFADSFKSEQVIIQSIGRALRLYEGKVEATIYDLVDILDINGPMNTLLKHYNEREKFYIKRKYPIDVTQINI